MRRLLIAFVCAGLVLTGCGHKKAVAINGTTTTTTPAISDNYEIDFTGAQSDSIDSTAAQMHCQVTTDSTGSTYSVSYVPDIGSDSLVITIKNPTTEAGWFPGAVTLSNPAGSTVTITATVTRTGGGFVLGPNAPYALNVENHGLDGSIEATLKGGAGTINVEGSWQCGEVK